MVAARHLKMLGMTPQIYIVKKPEKALFINLLKTCEVNDIQVFDHQELTAELERKNITLQAYFEENFDLIVDALFGFSFRGPIRKPYDSIISTLCNLKSNPLLFSVDIPSGWDVEKGTFCVIK